MAMVRYAFDRRVHLGRYLLHDFFTYLITWDLKGGLRLLDIVISGGLFGDAHAADVGHLSARAAREVRDAGILRNLAVVVARLVELEVHVVAVVVRVLVEHLIGFHGVGMIHGVELLVGDVHWVGVEARELGVESHCVLINLSF